jgi:hypothetical protein
MPGRPGELPREPREREHILGGFCFDRQPQMITHWFRLARPSATGFLSPIGHLLSWRGLYHSASDGLKMAVLHHDMVLQETSEVARLGGECTGVMAGRVHAWCRMPSASQRVLAALTWQQKLSPPSLLCGKAVPQSTSVAR